MENIRNRVDIKLCSNEKKVEKLLSQMLKVELSLLKIYLLFT